MIRTLTDKWYYKRWVFICFTFLLLVIILKTYKLGHGHKSNLKDVNFVNLPTTVTNTSFVFTYSDNLVYSAIIETRQRNCIKSDQNRQVCFDYKKCNSYTSDLIKPDELNVRLNGSLYSPDIDELNEPGTCARRNPGAIIIGTYKSGTRELIDFLAMNPSVVIKREPEYEVAYFDKNADKGDEWYKAQMPYSFKDQVTIEKSPSYFTSKQTPRRIYAFNQDIKLILIIRNPVDRAIAHLTFEKHIMGKQYDSNVYNCILKYNSLRNRTVLNKDCFAVKGSIYDEPMSRYLQHFSLDQILIVDGEEFQRAPCRVLKRVEHFLGLKENIRCQDFVYNKTKKKFCVKNLTVDNSAVCYCKNRGRQPLNYEDIRQQLHLFLKPHSERFFKLIGRTFNWK